MESSAVNAWRTAVLESRRLCELGDYSQALECLRRERVLQPAAGAPFSEMIRVCIIRGDRALAAKELQQYAGLEPQMPLSPFRDILSLQEVYIAVSERGDLDRAVQEANRIWKKYELDSASGSGSLDDEHKVLAGYYALEIYDLYRRYGEGLDPPAFELDPSFLSWIIPRLDSHRLSFEALEIAEFFVADPEDVLAALAARRLAEERYAAAGDATLRLAKAYFEGGKREEAEAALKFLDDQPTLCSQRTDVSREVLSLRYGVSNADDAGDANTARIRRLMHIAAELQRKGDLDDAMGALERAAELHSSLGGNDDRAGLGNEIHDFLRSTCMRSGDLLSWAQFEFRRCDMLAATPSATPETGLAAARLRRTELLAGTAVPICARLPFFKSHHRRQCLEYMMVGQREPALHHATAYLEHCTAVCDEDRVAVAENLRFKALLLPARSSDESRATLLEDIYSDLDKGAKSDAQRGRTAAYAEKVLLLAECAEELAELRGEEREDAWPPIAELLATAEQIISVDKTLRSHSTGELLALEVSYLKQIFSCPFFHLEESPDSHNRTVLEPRESDESIESAQSFSPTKFISELYIASQAESAALFGSLISKMEGLGQCLSARGHSLQKAQFSMSEAILYYVFAQYIELDIMKPLECGLKSKPACLRKALDCFEASLRAESEVEQQVYDSGGPDLARLLALQAYRTSPVKALLYEAAICISYEMENNDLLWKWVQRSKAHAYTTWLSTLPGRAQNQNPIPFTETTYEDLEWVSSATYRKVIFVDWVLARVNHDRSRLLVLALHFERDHDGTMRKLSVDELNAPVEDVEDWARQVSPARLDGPDWPRTLGPLGTLIQPLERYSRSGDILILSPTASLHGLPLHALSLPANRDYQPLMERNPVVYVPSMQVLVSCVRRLEAPSAGAERPRDWKAELFAAYNDADPNDEERNMIYRDMSELSERFGGSSPLLGSNLDPENFYLRSKEANLILFHGHGEISEHQPDQQSLVLGQGRLTLASAVKLDLCHAPHVTIIACWGGTQDFSLGGDEPLGLPAAFLAAGASSMVGPLWPIKSATGRSFARHFIDQSFLAQEVDRCELGPLINLAESVGHACNALRNGSRETATPYHWAAFALHGAWFCWRKPGT